MAVWSHFLKINGSLDKYLDQLSSVYYSLFFYCMNKSSTTNMYTLSKYPGEMRPGGFPDR